LDSTVREETPFVKRDLCDGCLNLKTRIPDTTLRTMKPPTKRAWVSEGGIHDVGFRHSQEQLARTDCTVATVLSNLPLVGCGVELAQISENIWRKGEAPKYALRTVLRWD
jgi:hypothetical protein